jgi:hypothetical protein
VTLDGGPGAPCSADAALKAGIATVFLSDWRTRIVTGVLPVALIAFRQAMLAFARRSACGAAAKGAT